MIIILGTTEKKIKSGQIKNVICPSCKKESILVYSVYIKYTYLTLIPLFPVGKRVEVQCKNCHTYIDYNELSDKDLEKFIDENEKVRNPVWTYLGILILIFTIVYYGYMYFKSSNNNSVFIKNPIANDILYTKDKRGYYSSLKIDKVTKDSVFTTQNEYQVSLPYEIGDINKTENYTTSKINFSKSEIIKMYQNEEIISIIRN